MQPLSTCACEYMLAGALAAHLFCANPSPLQEAADIYLLVLAQMPLAHIFPAQNSLPAQKAACTIAPHLPGLQANPLGLIWALPSGLQASKQWTFSA
eukprot:1145029-Pelagomonas_calceolata.AAC.3